MGVSTTISETEEAQQGSLVEPLLPPPVPPVSPLVVGEAGDLGATEEQRQRDEEASILYSETQILSIDESAWDHGVVQTTKCRNVTFAILFVIQAVVVVILAIMAIVDWPPMDVESKQHIHVPENMTSLVLFGITVLASTAALSTMILFLLLGTLAEKMIQISLVLGPLFCAINGLVLLFAQQSILALAFLGFAMIGICYAYSAWHRIPFATANIVVAVAAIRANKGVIPLSFATLFQHLVWQVVFALAVLEVFVFRAEWTWDCPRPTSNIFLAYDEDEGWACTLTSQGKWILLGLLLSCGWTVQVIFNVLHTTIAGVVGTFWFVGAPSRTTIDSSSGEPSGRRKDTTISDSWLRSCIYSFGSICLGSLFVAFMQVVHLLVYLIGQQRQRSSASSLLWCLLECIIDLLERLLEYINSWAFVYIGLYGYDYWTAGHKVYRLFSARGWSVILNDNLVAPSLRMTSLLIVILSGALTVLLGYLWFGPKGTTMAMFWGGYILGAFLSYFQLRVVSSAVETIMVCFAEAPSALLENHPPELGNRMIQAWRRAYPDECGF